MLLESYLRCKEKVRYYSCTAKNKQQQIVMLNKRHKHRLLASTCFSI